MYVSDRFEPESYDYFVVGSGPAGVSLALALADRKKRVLIFESGDEDNARTELSNSIGYGHYSGEYWNRHWVRALGGTSNVWTGWCTTLRELDLDNPAVGVRWPIARSELLPYWQKAAPDPRSRARVHRLREDRSFPASLSPRADAAADAVWRQVPRRGSKADAASGRRARPLDRRDSTPTARARSSPPSTTTTTCWRCGASWRCAQAGRHPGRRRARQRAAPAAAARGRRCPGRQRERRRRPLPDGAPAVQPRRRGA